MPTGEKHRVGGKAASAVVKAASAPGTLPFGVVSSTTSPEETCRSPALTPACRM